MEAIIQARKTGKTTQLIKRAANEKLYIVCRLGDIPRIQQCAIDLSLNIPQPISYDEFISGQYYSRGIGGFLIDEIDGLLNRISKGVPIHAFTMTPSSH